MSGQSKEVGSSQRRYSREAEEKSGSQGRGLTSDLPKAAVETAMGELREVMIQYANCADPLESAARKERVRRAEEEGQFEETAEQMVRASLNTSSTDSPILSSSVLELSPVRIHVALRVGPLNAPPIPPKPKKRTIAKKKVGRPPGRPLGRPPGPSLTKKASIPSPRLVAAGRTKKRKLLKVLPSPRRRLIMDPLLETQPEVLSVPTP
ncbi:predicted protein [Arabidopsis lyrata subsp. lyrata]|uniref:Predicted protein n=2 Tax=Arabidopsis lyrata subsp. lyrata TaxID=81972 RepID=D7LEZ3_ARALL|nr:predicted protein [Arabidopsis lyrata subsp. lyrata]